SPVRVRVARQSSVNVSYHATLPRAALRERVRVSSEAFRGLTRPWAHWRRPFGRLHGILLHQNGLRHVAAPFQNGRRGRLSNCLERSLAGGVCGVWPFWRTIPLTAPRCSE